MTRAMLVALSLGAALICTSCVDGGDKVTPDGDDDDTGTGGDADADADTDADADADADADSDADTDADTDADSDADSDADADAPEISILGALDRFVLRGMVVSPMTATAGEVLVVGNEITCVAADCSAEAGYDDATVIETNGIIAPGLIDAHNHILYNVFDEDDWAPAQLYDNHDQWPQEDAYQEMQDCYDYLLDSTSASPPGVNIDCEVLKYGEIKALIGGATSVLGEPKGSPQRCFASLARSIDGRYNDLPETTRTYPCFDVVPDPVPEPDDPRSDHMQVAALGIGTVDETNAFENFYSCKTWSYVIHIAEGVQGNSSAYDEWLDTQADGMDVQQLSVIHGTAMADADFAHMASVGAKLIWSPRSNMSLYGETTAIDVAIDYAPDLIIGLGPDWSMGGSVNMLDELRYAREIDQQLWGGVLSPEDLVEMATINGARALEVHDFLGSLEAGKLADIIVLSGDAGQPYEAIVSADVDDLRLVMVNGVWLYGDAALSDAAALPGCETVDVCGRDRFLCAAEPSTEDKLDQTYAEITSIIGTALDDYDAANGTSYAPIAPLVDCGDG